MADIRAFRGLRFHSNEVDPGARLCPPYDVISPEAQSAYHARSPWNVIRIELGHGSQDQTTHPNRYDQAAETLSLWIHTGVLVADARPAVYLYQHSFLLDGLRVTRTGLFVAGRLHDWAEGVVRPHEHTRAGPKIDRLALLEATKVNTSPLWMIYHDTEGAVARALETAGHRPPDIVAEEGGETHSLTVIDTETVVAAVCEAFASLPIYVADGHHRYETALHYRDTCRATGSDSRDAPHEFALMLLVATSDPGLVIRPYHRIIGATGLDVAEVLAELRAQGDVDVAPISGGVEGAVVALHHMSSSADVACVVWSRNQGWIVTPRATGSWRNRIPAGHASVWEELDVVIIDVVIVHGGFRIDASAEERGEANEIPRLRYTPDARAAIASVQEGAAEVAILVRPTKVGQVCAVADAGDRMPPKSTYFFPKPTTGLLFRALQD